MASSVSSRAILLSGCPCSIGVEADDRRSYRGVLEQAGDRPVTIRMLDIGGDKPLAGLEDLPVL
ncbi:putative PEP-binding protein, partial [Rhizobium johnstonii]|uniref:putative PEP-binding protein n=1 Tax=Rhizobium johnstonii TaxID=3019933 RepID=UPI003F96B596